MKVKVGDTPPRRLEKTPILAAMEIHRLILVLLARKFICVPFHRQGSSQYLHEGAAETISITTKPVVHNLTPPRVCFFPEVNKCVYGRIYKKMLYLIEIRK